MSWPVFRLVRTIMMNLSPQPTLLLEPLCCHSTRRGIRLQKGHCHSLWRTYSKNKAEDDELFVTHSTLEKQLSSTSYKIKSLLVVPPTDTPTPATTDGTGVKLPKLDVHMFDGNNTHWKRFWDQFTVAVHSKSSLSNTEKIVYLQHTIKDGSAWNALEGLSHSVTTMRKLLSTSSPATTDRVSFNTLMSNK